MRFCLQLDNRLHIGTEYFGKITRIPIDQTFRQCLTTNSTYKGNLQNNQSKQYCYQKLFFKTLPTPKDESFESEMFVVFRAFYLEWLAR